MAKDKLIYAATKRCPCGAGLAYREGMSPHSGYWDCSAIMLGSADEKVQHCAQYPFAFYEVLSENQPSAEGATTRG